MGKHTLIFGLFLIFFSSKCYASWGTPGLGQYHIQTDEGPERFFRYQTDNGQYRKEKRLQDGTVIGTDAWIDASGFLRQKDYIADNQGYRILKSKTIFVGKGRPIEEAMRYVKNLPAQAGALVKHDSPSIADHNRPSTNALYTTPLTSTVVPTKSTIPTTLISSTYLGYDHYSTPKVFIRHHSQPVNDDYYSPHRVSTTPISTISTDGYYPTTTASPVPTPSKRYEPPYQDKYSKASFYPQSTPPTPIADFGGPIAVYPPSTTISPPFSSTPSYSSTGHSLTSSVPGSTASIFSEGSTYPAFESRFKPISSTTPQIPLMESSTPRSVLPLGSNDVDAQPVIYSRPTGPAPTSLPYIHSYPDGGLQYNNHLGNGYDPHYAYYDGVSSTHDGFRYYLPRHYHEEDNHDPNRKAGSFGYIDPFGIRRVIYYNASPEDGFVHRKNNRYVGFNAKPYDPRPRPRPL